MTEAKLPKSVVEARIDGIEKAIDVFNENINRVPTQLDRGLIGLRELLTARIEVLDGVVSEKFIGNKLAVDAAFAAAKEATSKIEASFQKANDSQQTLIFANSKSTDDKISDLKDRLTAIEARTAGISAQATAQRSDTGLNISLIMMLIGIASLVATALTFALK